MTLEFRKARIPEEISALCEFDRRVFHDYPTDLFTPETWEELETWWMIADGETVGCSAIVRDVDYTGDPSPGTLYIMTTGVLPEYRNRGYGRAQKEWQIDYARRHGFRKIVTNCRQSNQRMIALNQDYGFRIREVDPGYYHEPTEAAVVLELELGRTPNAGRSEKQNLKTQR